MIFIAGIERSASTWVSNLLESHPDTEVFLEPLSIYISRFSEWPTRFETIKHLDSKATYFKDELSVLKERKRWLFTKISEESTAWNIDLTLADFLVKKNLASDHVNDFYELNFHRKDSYSSFQKSRNARLDVVKTLRLNFNPSIFQHIDNSPKVIITLRDMASNVRSILTQIERGNLTELKSLLLEKYNSVDIKSVFMYWRDSYNSLLQYADESVESTCIFDHTAMLQHPTKVIDELIDFTGLKKTESVQSFLEASNRSGEGIHSTNRDHEKLMSRIQKDRAFVYPKIRELLINSNLHPELEKRINI